MHEYGYRISTREGGEVEFADHLGRAVRAVPDLPTPPERGVPALRAQHRHLGITAETAACGWDGHRVEYGLVIDGLVRSEQPTSPKDN